MHAWDITKGSANILVGINDTYYETTHDDLENKYQQILSNGTPGMYAAYHGTAVSFCAGGDTDNNIGLSSTGFNTKLLFKTARDVEHLLDLAQAGADIVNASYCGCFWNSHDSTVIEEIHDLGAIIVAGAGNGPEGTSCGEGHGYCYPASYPHVISVSSVSHLNPYGTIDPTYGAYAWADCHEDSINHPTRVHTHNNKVDLCSQGYHVGTATLNNSYTAAWGTSFSAPVVAGLCALVLSVDPSLDPDEVETILKNTAFDVTTIPENQEFSGLLGAGRINAYAAVNAAREGVVNYASIPYSTGFESGVDENWTFYESNRFGRCVRESDHSPHTGSYHLTMDVIENNNYNTNEAWMHLNLSGESDVALQFWWKETGDETHTTDGIYLSDNGGGSFTKIYSLSGGSSTYIKANINLSYELDDNDLDHSSSVVVKFQQYDNYTMPTDGIAIDDIKICIKPSIPSPILGPFQHCTDDIEEYQCGIVSGAVEYDWDTSPGSGLSIYEDGSRFVECEASEQGYYTLKVRAKNECDQYGSFRSRSIWIDDCGGQRMMVSDLFTIMPNPTDDFMDITLNQTSDFYSESMNDGFAVDIYNQANILLKQETTKGKSLQIYTGDLINGIYIFRILYDKAVYTYNVIVQH